MIQLSVVGGGRESVFRFSFAPYPRIEYLDDTQPRLEVARGYQSVDLAAYLNSTPFRFHLGDGSVLQGGELFAPPEDDHVLYDDALARAVDWEHEKVDGRREYGDCTPNSSIHAWLEKQLVHGDDRVVLYDHRSGECADFLTVSVTDDGDPVVALYHCKGAGGPPSGERVGDLYEVCGQAIKSTQWRHKRTLLEHVRRRVKSGSQFVKGDLKLFIELVEPCGRHEFRLEIWVVQPGVSRSALAPRLKRLLATTSRGLVASGCERLRLLCAP